MGNNYQNVAFVGAASGNGGTWRYDLTLEQLDGFNTALGDQWLYIIGTVGGIGSLYFDASAYEGGAFQGELLTATQMALLLKSILDGQFGDPNVTVTVRTDSYPTYVLRITITQSTNPGLALSLGSSNLIASVVAVEEITDFGVFPSTLTSAMITVGASGDNAGQSHTILINAYTPDTTLLFGRDGASEGNVTTDDYSVINGVSPPSGYSIASGGIGFNYVILDSGSNTYEPYPFTKIGGDISEFDISVVQYGFDDDTVYINVAAAAFPGIAFVKFTSDGSNVAAYHIPTDYTLYDGGVGNPVVRFQYVTAGPVAPPVSFNYGAAGATKSWVQGTPEVTGRPAKATVRSSVPLVGGYWSFLGWDGSGAVSYDATILQLNEKSGAARTPTTITLDIYDTPFASRGVLYFESASYFHIDAAPWVNPDEAPSGRTALVAKPMLASLDAV